MFLGLRLSCRTLALAGAIAVSLLWSGRVRAEETEDKPQDVPRKEHRRQLQRYHDSVIAWENHVTAATLGIGDDPQSRNPTYTMGFSGQGRFYLRDELGDWLYVGANLGLYREFTNSDSTTQRGEWALTDGDLALHYVRRLLGAQDSDTTLGQIRGVVRLPTSQASFDSGRYFLLGGYLAVTQVNPLLKGRFKPGLTSALRLGVGYGRWFSRATVPTQPSLERVRLTPDGQSVAGDQLSGSSLVRDMLSFQARWQLLFGDFMTWSTEFSFNPAWKYDVQDQVDVCGVVATGCATVRTGQDDTRYLAITEFSTELSFQLFRGVSLQVGYLNAANQLGPDGQRQGVFYSPGAEFYTALSLTPHELVSPPAQSAASSSAPRSF